MKKLISIVLVCILGMMVIIPAAADNLTEQKKLVSYNLKQIRSKISKSIAEKNQLNKDIQYLKSQAHSESAEYNKLMSELDSASNEINLTEGELNECEESLIENDRMFQSRIRAMYINSRKSKLSILLKCKNLTELFSVIETMRMVSKQDQQTLGMLETDKKEVEVKIEMLEGLVENLRNNMDQKKQRLQTLTISRADKEKEIEKKKVEISSLEKQENEEEKEFKAIENEIKKRMSKAPYTQGTMLWPVPSVTKHGSPFGMRLHPIYKKWKMHTGVDIGASKNADIVASNDGTVIMASWSNGYGNRVVIDHGGGISTLYAHCNKMLVKVGQKVKRGDKIALIGSTGVSTGPHLHFEVRVNGAPVNPIGKYLKK